MRLILALALLLVLASASFADELSPEARLILNEIVKLRSEVMQRIDNLDARVSDLEAMRTAEQSRRDAEQAAEAKETPSDRLRREALQVEAARVAAPQFDRWGRPISQSSLQAPQQFVPQQVFIPQQQFAPSRGRGG